LISEFGDLQSIQFEHFSPKKSASQELFSRPIFLPNQPLPIISISSLLLTYSI
jgi:hypothetical protein